MEYGRLRCCSWLGTVCRCRRSRTRCCIKVSFVGEVRVHNNDILVHDENTPCNRPLLDCDESTSLGGRCKFTDVDRDLSRFETDGQTVDHTASDEHSDILRSANNNRTDDPSNISKFLFTEPAEGHLPKPTSKDYRLLTTNPIRNRTRK